MRENSGTGQQVNEKYAAPLRDGEFIRKTEEGFAPSEFDSLSAALDAHYLEIEAEKAFQAKVGAARNKLNQETKKREKLLKNLNKDLENHGDAEQWKRFGDLLLANIALAKRDGDAVYVTDFYDENTPTVEIKVEEHIPLTEAAEKFFKRYTKARNAKEEVTKRLDAVKAELSDLREQRQLLERAVSEKDEGFFAEFADDKNEKPRLSNKEKQTQDFKGARQYLSSDSFEILVGKRAKDNDYLTFRVAKSLDLWLHAADYPGSHVVIKNPNRAEIPPKTLLEAAQIAAFFSQAGSQGKVAVHYTQKKFVGKPKGAAPGLVSLSSFKTILVEPKIVEQ